MNNEQLIEKIKKCIELNRYARKGHIVTSGDEALAASNNILAQVRTVIKNSEKEYERGLEDAWALARKIILTGEGFYTRRDLVNIFGDYEYMPDIFNEYQTYKDVIAKINEYESKLKPGDVVEYIGKVSNESYKGIFLSKSLDNDDVWILDKNCDCPQLISRNLFTIKKIGKHVNLEGLFAEIE